MKTSFRPARLWPVFASSIFLAGGLCLAQTPVVPTLTPAASEVLKLAKAGLDAGLIKTYITNVAGPFSLDATGIIYLTQAGVPSDVINLMLTRDGAAVAAAAVPAPAPAPATPVPAAEPPPVTAPAPDATAAPAPAPDMTPGVDMTVDALTQALTPYGVWVEVDGYGRCWRPTVGMYNPGWLPYCDRGQWVYTDAGWYWNSDYAWGIAFHYGRWFYHPHWGWCWWPDTVWAPSWVLWRADEDDYGWAPLPPFALFQPGYGFYYNGMLVGADYDFGLDVNYFIFVPAGSFGERNPGQYRLDAARRAEVFHRATLVGGFSAHGHGVANRGIPVERVSAAVHQTITPVAAGQVASGAWSRTHAQSFQPAGQSQNFPNNNGAVRQAPNESRSAPVIQNRPYQIAEPPRSAPNTVWQQPRENAPVPQREESREEPRASAPVAEPRQSGGAAPSQPRNEPAPASPKNPQGH